MTRNYTRFLILGKADKSAVRVPGSTSLVFCHDPDTTDEYQIFSDKGPDQAGLYVVTDRDPTTGQEYILRILPSKNIGYSMVASHGVQNHSFYSLDPVIISSRQIRNFAPFVSGLTLTICEGPIFRDDNTVVKFPDTQIDVTADRPTSGVRFVLYSIDPATLGVVKTYGNIVASRYLIEGTALPQNPDGLFPVAYLILSSSVTNLSDNQKVSDVIDARKLFSLGGGSSGSGDMLKSVYDIDDDGIVDSAATIHGVDLAGNDKYWGTDGAGTPGFHDIPTNGVGDMTKAEYDADDDGVVDAAASIEGANTAGNSKYFGTSVTGAVGFHDLPAGDVEEAPVDGKQYARKDAGWAEVAASVDETRLLPAGGTEGQVLAKATVDDYDAKWTDPPAGGGGGTPIEEIEAWITPTLINGWVPYGGGWAAPGYYKRDGRVYLRGLLKNGTIDASMFILPEGYRPGNEIILGATTVNGTFARLDVYPDGQVYAANGSNAYFSISSVSFRVESDPGLAGSTPNADLDLLDPYELHHRSDTPHAGDDEFDAATRNAAWVEQTVSGVATWVQKRHTLSVKFSGQASAQAACVLKPLTITDGSAYETSFRGIFKALNYFMLGLVITNGTDPSSSSLIMLMYTNEAIPATATSGLWLGTLSNIIISGSTEAALPRDAINSGRIRLLRESATVYKGFVSTSDGVMWSSYGMTSINPGFTPTHVGLFVSTFNRPEEGIASFDYLRVITP